MTDDIEEVLYFPAGTYKWDEHNQAWRGDNGLTPIWIKRQGKKMETPDDEDG